MDRLDSWYLLVKDKSKQRVVLVHNNLKLEHMIKGTDEYLISWDQYTFDSPVLDLVNLYKKINIILYALVGLQIAKLPVLGAFILIGISVALSLIAGLIPSGFAAKRDPAEALRTE